MAIQRYAYKDVDGTANTLVLETVLVSSAARKYFVKNIVIQEITSTEQNNAIIEVWLADERLAQVPIESMLAVFDAATKAWKPMLELNVSVPEGFELKVGHTSGGTASNIQFVLQYEHENE